MTRTLFLVFLGILVSAHLAAQAPDVSPATPAPAVETPSAAPPAAPAPETPVAPPSEPTVAPEPVPTPEATPAPAPDAPAPADEAVALPPAAVVKLAPGPDLQTQVQEAFIVATPGTVFEFAEGRYDFTMGLSLDVDNCVIRGAGHDKTVFDFSRQDAGSEGLLVTADHVTLEDFGIENAKGNCFKSNAANQLFIRRVRAEWTGGPKETNGAYGLYPVNGRDILIEDCIVRGASDAGIYVGQSENIIVRRNTVELNVAGIEIENCYYADVFENTATTNTGGILVFDLPGLPKQRGRNVRVLKNKIFDNNTPNFAPKGNIVAKVPKGTGIMIMSNSNVHVFENEIRDHATTNLFICSYLASGNEITDPNYYPFPEGIYVHSNTFGICGKAPDGEFGQLAASLVGPELPDILWDGVLNPLKAENGQLPEEFRLYIENNTKTGGGEVSFANVDAFMFMTDPANAVVKRDITVHAGQLPPLAPIVIPGVS